jgi:hypothetical protein
MIARTVQTTFVMSILSLDPSEKASELNLNLDVIKRWEVLDRNMLIEAECQESPI